MRRIAGLTALLLLAGACLVVALPGCGGGSSPAPAVGSIHGYVFGQVAADTAGRAIAVGSASTPPAGYEPLADAVIMVTGRSVLATTDAEGYFRVDNLPVGAQTVTISKTGYLTAAVSVTVVAEQVVSVGEVLLQPAERKWTVLVFLNANNNLESLAWEDLNEMEMVGSSAEVDIIVQLATLSTPARRLRIIRDDDPATVTSPTLPGGELGQVDMGDWRVLRDFVQWGTANYPAEHYLLVVWNHGTGWRSTSEAAITRGVSYDDLSGNHIAVWDLPRALDVQPRLDIVAFDACLMQMVEVAYEIRHFARIMVGSEDNWPNQGYPYHTFLAPLVANPSMLPEQFATEIVTQSIAHYLSQGSTMPLTQSAVSLAAMDAVALALDGFARALAAAMPAYSSQIASARTQAQTFADRNNKDLYDFARLTRDLVPVAGVASSAQAVMSAIDNAVIANATSTARRNSQGLAIFIPNSTDYNFLYQTTYPLLELCAATAWDEWLAVSPP